jgi:hypothetical protein
LVQQSRRARGFIRAIRKGLGRILRPAILAAASLLLSSVAVHGDDRFTVCSITINSDDEVRTFERYLPQSEFRFVELTEHARMAAAESGTSWFGRACGSGVRCDVLLVSGHFGNTWAGNYGTTFAGSSGISLGLEELEQRRCEESCSGILADPLEVFLFGCKTLADGSDGSLAANDLALLGRHEVPAAAAARLVDEARNRGEDTSSRRRMQFVFGGVPRLYGFTDVAPSGKRVAPLLEKYLQGVGDYGAHLRRLRQTAHADQIPAIDGPLARALEPTCFAQANGVDPAGPEYRRSVEACFLANDRNSIGGRLEYVEQLFEAPRFLSSLTAIDSFFRAHPTASAGATALASLDGVRDHARARSVALELFSQLESPVLRLEVLRVARSMGWISATEALPVQRQVVARLLRPPVYGEGRNLICGLGPDVLERIDIRAEDVPTEAYADEYGIQALGCLRPTDERIHERLAQSLFDPREWIARLAAIALKGMRPAELDVQLALAKQLGRQETGLRQWAGEALRALKPANPRVLAAIRETDPSFDIDWL